VTGGYRGPSAGYAERAGGQACQLIPDLCDIMVVETSVDPAVGSIDRVDEREFSNGMLCLLFPHFPILCLPDFADLPTYTYNTLKNRRSTPHDYRIHSATFFYVLSVATHAMP
jgi:hypothetical protein